MLRNIDCMIVAVLFAAACGTNDDIASSDPTDDPVAANTAPVTAEPSPVTPVPTMADSTEPSSTPTPTPEPTLYVHSSGLACYGDRSTEWTYNFDPDLVVGVPSVDEAAALWWMNEAVGRWWLDRDGMYTVSAEDLTRHPSQEDSVAFRDDKGNAQVVLYAAQLPDGNWIIEAGTSCA